MHRHINIRTNELAKMPDQGVCINPVIRSYLDSLSQQSLPSVFQNPTPLCNDERTVGTHIVEPTHSDYTKLLRLLRRRVRDEVRAAAPSALHDVDLLLQFSPIVNIVRELYADQHLHAIILAYRAAARRRLSVLTSY